MPCVEKFLEQSENYKEDLIPFGYKTIAVEGIKFWLVPFSYNEKYLITIDKWS